MSRRPGLGALLLLLLAVASSAFLNLAFTLPLILLGLSLALFSRTRLLRRCAWIADGGLLAGITAVMLGLAMSVVNLQRSGWFSSTWSALLRPLQKPAATTHQPTVSTAESSAPAPAPPSVIDEGSRHVGDYGTPAAEGAWVSGPDQSLGYRYRTGLKPLRSRLVGQDSGRVIYDVLYSFDA